jgi:hypothetical protein
MIRIYFSAASLLDPGDSANTFVGEEVAVSCDGSECGATVFSEDGELEILPPHWHIVERGTVPEAGPRRYPVWANKL